MIFITQLIYILKGQEAVFDQFESMVIPSISKYNGKLLFRLRPAEESYVACEVDKPYEIHLVHFDSEDDLLRYMQDEERKKFLHLKEQSIQSAIMIKGTKL